MLVPLVWSELPEPNADRLAHDCAYSSILMCLIFGGKLTYPLGIYSVAEREALEGSDTRPDEEGGSPADIDLAILTRYGLVAHHPAAGATTRAVLTTPNLAVSVGGSPADAPVGSVIRKYYSGTKGHRGVYLTSEKRWLDPLAPNKSAGNACPVGDVVAFASKRSTSDLRYFSRDELSLSGGINQGDDMGLKLRVPDAPATKTVRVAKGKTILRVSDRASFPLDADVTRAAYATVLLNDDGSAHDNGWIVNHVRFGVTEEWFVSGRDVT